MLQPNAVTVTPSLLRSLRTLLVGNLLMVGGIIGIAIGLVGVGSWTVVTCVAVVAVSTMLYVLAALRQRPRVVITPEGFAFEKLFGHEAHPWQEIEGQFGVIKIGWNDAVAYKLTPECKARTGKKPTSLFSGYDAAVSGAFTLSAEELAGLLNEYRRRYLASAGTEAGGIEKPAEPVAAPDRDRR